MLAQKIDGNLSISFDRLSIITGYSKRHLIRLSDSIKKEGIDSTLKHKNTGLPAHNRANHSEIDYLIELKKLYPVITIAQFRDIYTEDILESPIKKNDIDKYNLKPRSISWFQNLFKQMGWKSPIKHRSHKTNESLHLLRQRSPREGMLIQIDGTPFDWFGNGQVYSLHIAVDDATKKVLAGWFTKNESQLGYCRIMYLIIKKYGIPLSVYSDKHTIFKSPKDDGITQFGMMMEDLGIEMIFANTSQAKGRVERYNGTAQNRLPNDIIRFGIKDYDELNEWFNEYYVEYLNQKFSYMPLDPNTEFIPFPPHKDLNMILSLRSEREILNGNMFSYRGYYYIPYDANGEVVKIRKTTKVKTLECVLDRKIYIKYFGHTYECQCVEKNQRRNQKVVSNQKELQEVLNRKK